MIKIDKNINLLEFPGFQYPYCNCLWITDDINCLIDTSVNDSHLANLLQNKIDLILNTHGHIDHYVNNDSFPNARILMHPADHDIALSSDEYLIKFGFKSLANPDVHQLILDGVRYKTTRIDGNIEDQQMFNLGAIKFETLHLPGHSPGHCGFWFPEQGFVFTSDIDLSVFGPWYANLNSSLTDFLASIERLLKLKPDYIVTGHGGPIIKENVSRRIKEYRDIIYARQRRIIDLIHHGRHSINEIAKELPVYVHLPKPTGLFYIYEQTMISIHLQYLQEQGYVVQEDENYYLKAGIHPSKIHNAIG